MIASFAPGTRVQIRDAEWIVKRVDATSTGGSSLLVVGASEIVRDKEARFLTEIEGKTITPLNPADTTLVPDASPQYRDTRLYLESLLRQSPPTDANLYVAHRAAVDDLPYQLDPAILALEQPRQRILMADATGLGKTIEAGMLLSELIKRGRGKRILAITVKSMMTQFQKELWARFTIPLMRLDSAGINRVRNLLPANANPFHYYDKAIISIDTLKQESEYRVYLENAYWDIILIDEAQNVAERGSRAQTSMRARVARLLSTRSDTLIMTSATPHDGRAASFASLMNMLNPTAIADPDHYGPDDIKGLFLRRFKKDVQAQVSGSFKERRVIRYRSQASAQEEAAFDLLTGLTFRSFDRVKRSGQHLFKTVLVKALFSSPAACLQTIRQRLKKLEADSRTEATHDQEQLKALEERVAEIGPAEFSKYQTLLKELAAPTGLDWNGASTSDRLVIFTERIETLRFLEQHLKKALRLKDEQIAVLHGDASGLSDLDVQKTVEEFGRDQSPLRLLIASDIASEGINLHFLSHKMVHFDIPWSLMVFQQRNGRIDRYGQECEPHIAYLSTTSVNDEIRGDSRILELLTEKDEQAAKNIGDPSAFYGLYDEQQEELRTGGAMEARLSAEALNAQMEKSADEDVLTFLFGGDVPDGTTAVNRKRAMPSLYENNLAYVKHALESVGGRHDLQPAFDVERQMVSVTLSGDLQKRLLRAVPEAVGENGRVHLTSDRREVKDAIRRCRAEERAWPEVQLLWDLHPLVEWLNLKVLVAFGRHQAPLVTLAGRLARRESIFLLHGDIPNRKRHPVVHQWFAVSLKDGRYVETLALEGFLRRTGLGTSALANSGAQPDVMFYQGLLPTVVAEARQFMSARRSEYERAVNPKLEEERRNLERLRGAQRTQLEIQFPADDTLKGVRLEKKQAAARAVERTFDDYTRWVADTMTTEDHASIRISAVFVGED